MKITFSLGSMTAARLAGLCEGELLYLCCENKENISISGICTDSREADAETAFCAIRGERVDGHDYLSAAHGAGCRVMLCERAPQTPMDAAVILVKDTEEALSVLARHYQEALSCKKVAVTGSVGKTTTKDMIAAVLGERFQAFKTKGNFNSVIGMPLSLLEISKATEYAVLEMGMSRFGEIERLSLTARPDFAVITTIGSSHLEMLGSRENICRAKLEVLCGLKEGGTLLLNGDEPLLSDVYGKSYNTVYISTERENADYFAKNIRVESDGTVFDIVYRGKTVKDLRVRVVGRHNVYSALFSFAIASICGMNEEEIRRGLLRFMPEHLRQNIVRFGRIVVMEDCYNASPESMQAAIDVLDSYSRFSGGRSIAVLGDMLELGEESSALHRQVGAHLAKRRIGRLFTLGKGGGYIAVGAKQQGMSFDAITEFASYEERLDEIAAAIASVVGDEDVVLFKASRAVRIERLIDRLRSIL